MKSHELAKLMLNAPDGKIFLSIDVCQCSEDCGVRAMGVGIELNNLPSNVGFGSPEVQLVAEGGFNMKLEASECLNNQITNY